MQTVFTQKGSPARGAVGASRLRGAAPCPANTFPGLAASLGLWDDASIVPYDAGQGPCRGLKDTRGSRRQCTLPSAPCRGGFGGRRRRRTPAARVRPSQPMAGYSAPTSRPKGRAEPASPARPTASTAARLRARRPAAPADAKQQRRGGGVDAGQQHRHRGGRRPGPQPAHQRDGGAGSARDSGARQKARCSSASAAPKMPQPSQGGSAGRLLAGQPPGQRLQKRRQQVQVIPSVDQRGGPPAAGRRRGQGGQRLPGGAAQQRPHAGSRHKGGDQRAGAAQDIGHAAQAGPAR